MANTDMVFLMPDQDCNLVLYDVNGGVLFATQTTKQFEPNATPPCRAVVSGAGGGFLAIIDSFANGDQSDTALYTRPLVGNGIMNEGQILPQVLLPCPFLGLTHRPACTSTAYHPCLPAQLRTP